MDKDNVFCSNKFWMSDRDKLHVIMPADHPVIPWTTLVFGLWVPSFYYWGLNQFITQRTLAAKSLKQGQLGILFAALLKLAIPFVIIIPGIISWQLFRGQLTAPGATTDQAYPLLIRNLVGPGLRGFILAAISGAKGAAAWGQEARLAALLASGIHASSPDLLELPLAGVARQAHRRLLGRGRGRSGTGRWRSRRRSTGVSRRGSRPNRSGGPRAGGGGRRAIAQLGHERWQLVEVFQLADAHQGGSIGFG